MIYKVSTQMFQLSNYAAVQQSQLSCWMLGLSININIKSFTLGLQYSKNICLHSFKQACFKCQLSVSYQ